MNTPFHVKTNYEVFEKLLPGLLITHAGKFALMHDRQIVGLFHTHFDAYLNGQKLFEDKLFFVQKVTETPVDLGFFSAY